MKPEKGCGTCFRSQWCLDSVLNSNGIWQIWMKSINNINKLRSYGPDSCHRSHLAQLIWRGQKNDHKDSKNGVEIQSISGYVMYLWYSIVTVVPELLRSYQLYPNWWGTQHRPQRIGRILTILSSENGLFLRYETVHLGRCSDHRSTLR